MNPTDLLLRVALLEDDAETRRWFEQCIDGHPSLVLAASFATLKHAQAWFASHSADVLLTDLALPDGHGLTLIQQLARQRPECDVLVVSVFGDEQTVLACVEAGAVGYVHKDAEPEDVAQAVLAVKRGASPISPMLARRLLTRYRALVGARAAPVSDVTLSPRESEVLDLISRGYSYAEIARLKSLTVHTVQTHIKNLYSKLAVHSRGEAVFEASRMGLLPGLQAAS